MRKTMLAFALLCLGINAWAGPKGFVGKPSRYSVPETVDRLVTVLQSKGMTVFARTYPLACAKFSATCAQWIVFHHASMYSARRF